VRIGVVGSRRRNSKADKAIVYGELDRFVAEGGAVIVSGGCKTGADKFAREYALDNGLELVEHLPDLTGVRGRSDAIGRYYARNAALVADCDILVAIVAENRRGGTENALSHAYKRSIPVHIWEVDASIAILGKKRMTKKTTKTHGGNVCQSRLFA